jgi:hypothetical protein
MEEAQVVFIVTEVEGNIRNVAVTVTCPPPNGTVGPPTLVNV